MAPGPRELSPELKQRRSRLYELAPQMRLYHRVLNSQVWEPFVMRACVPNIRHEVLQTDAWGLRRTIGRDGRELTVESVARDEPVDIVTGASLGFGVGATSDAATLPSQLAQATGRATLCLSGHRHTLAQNFVQFMFFAGRFDRIRNIAVCGFGELYFFHTCEMIFRQYGLFQFDRRFLTALNGNLEGRRAAALFGARNRPIVPLTRRPERIEAEREVLRGNIRDTLTSWSRFAAALGARLTLVSQPSPELQARALSPEEEELMASHDALSGLREQLDAAKADYLGWHRPEMEALCAELGIGWFEVNDALGGDFDGRWLHLDRLHMTDAGYAAAAQAIAPKLAG